MLIWTRKCFLEFNFLPAQVGWTGKPGRSRVTPYVQMYKIRLVHDCKFSRSFQIYKKMLWKLWMYMNRNVYGLPRRPYCSVLQLNNWTINNALWPQQRHCEERVELRRKGRRIPEEMRTRPPTPPGPRGSDLAILFSVFFARWGGWRGEMICTKQCDNVRIYNLLQNTRTIKF